MATDTAIRPRFTRTISGLEGFCAAPDGGSCHLMWLRSTDSLYLVFGDQLVRVEPARFAHDGTEKGARDAMRRFLAEGVGE